MYQEIVDLSLPVTHGLKTFPSHPPAVVMDFVTHEFSAPRYRPPCEGFATKLLVVSDHVATHVDAPLHFVKGGADVASVPLQRMLGRAICLDFADKPARDFVTAAMIERRLREKGLALRRGDRVLIRSWPGAWAEEGFYECQGPDESAGRLLLEAGASFMGVDLALADVAGDMRRPLHMMLLGAGVVLAENLVNLDRLPQDRAFLFMALPLRIAGGTGSPVRAVAILDAEVEA
jgi:kynurenine formamidase